LEAWWLVADALAASGPRIVVEGGALDDLLAAALERQSVLPYFQLDGSNCSDEKVPHLVGDQLAHQLVSGKKLEGDKPSVDSSFSMVAQKACAFSPQARAVRLHYQMMASASTCIPLLEGNEEV
jgi:hypothetical protein